MSDSQNPSNDSTTMPPRTPVDQIQPSEYDPSTYEGRIRFFDQLRFLKRQVAKHSRGNVNASEVHPDDVHQSTSDATSDDDSGFSSDSEPGLSTSPSGSTCG